MPLSTSAISSLLSLLFHNDNWANVGDVTGLRGSGTAGSLYIGLHTAKVGRGNPQNTNECAYGGYARKAVARADTEWVIAAPQVSNINALAFPLVNSGTETALFWTLGFGASGATVVLFEGPLTSAFLGFTAKTDDTITIPGHALAVDDLVVFYRDASGIALPTGITEGDIYWVKTSSGDDITVATSQGGATVDLTTVGAGLAAEVAPFAISSGKIPTIAAGALVVVAE